MNKKIKLCCAITILGFIGFCGGKAIVSQQNVAAPHPKTTPSSNMSRVIKVKTFNRIKFAAYRPDIKISSGKKFQVIVKGNQGANINKIKTEVKNKQLIITDKPEQSYRDGNYYINITIPRTKTIKKIDGYCDSSDFSLKRLNIPQVNLTFNFGDVTLNGLKSKNSHLKLKGGDLKITNSKLSNASFSLGEGDASINNSSFKANVKMGKLGDVKVKNSKLLGNSSFNLDEGDFQMSNAPKISYKLSTEDPGDVMVHNKFHHYNFSKILSRQPLLKVTSKGGDITIN